MEKLESEIKHLVIKTLKLEDIGVDDIDSQAPLFGNGLGLDSIDALELGVAIKKKYDITLGSYEDRNKEYFASVESLAKFIRLSQTKE